MFKNEQIENPGIGIRPQLNVFEDLCISSSVAAANQKGNKLCRLLCLLIQYNFFIDLEPLKVNRILK